VGDGWWPLVTSRLKRLVAATSVALVAAPSAAAAVHVTPVQRVPFPKVAYVVDIGRDTNLTAKRVRLSENGVAVHNVKIRPLAASSINSGVILTIDASNSMRGRPFAAALAATRAFAGTRVGAERIGAIAFNSRVHVVQEPTADAEALGAALTEKPLLAKGTRIYDAVAASLELLRKGRLAAGAVIVLSDGADTGSVATPQDVVAQARRQHVRIFTVGLLSRTYNAQPLRDLARETGGSYFQAASTVELEPIYADLGQRLASQYLITYRSPALPSSTVIVRFDLAGAGIATSEYKAPRPSTFAPFHRSLLKRFVLSSFAVPLMSIILAALLGGVIALLLKRQRHNVVGRIEDFLRGVRAPADRLKATGKNLRSSVAKSTHAEGWIGKLERDLEIAEIDIPAQRLIAFTAGATVIVCFICVVLSPILIVLGLLTPLAARGYVKRKLKNVRTDFGEQLPANLQVLASAMRAGYSFGAALAVVVENAHEPSRRELRRAVNDEQLGIAMDEALRRVAARMENRDLQQVALLSELQRTAGGNAAEVLDTAVETIRERGEIRRLVRTLTAQGRMARWILTALPVFVAFFLRLLYPEMMKPLFTSTGGRIALTLAALMVAAGSWMIERIVDIKV
jgi:tight adherence protein B